MNRLEACNKFFDKLAYELRDSYEVIGSCNKDSSRYLIPKGTESQITYYGKPALSFRVSDHWSWYSNTKKCADKNYIQCHSMDLPRPKRRKAEGKASDPIIACQVAIIGPDGNYHHVFGDKFNGIEWTYEEKDITSVLKLVERRD